MAGAAEVAKLAAMAKTICGHLKGIFGYRKLGGATNAPMEGFNAKVRWLVKQAYGFRDFKYFRLRFSTRLQPTSASDSRPLSRITGKSRKIGMVEGLYIPKRHPN